MITDNTLSLLEFDKLLAKMAFFANSERTKEVVLNIRPFQNRRDIEDRFGQIQDIRRLSQTGSPLKLSAFSAVSHLIRKTRPEGAVLEAIELSAFIPLLKITSEISGQISGNPEFPCLRDAAGDLRGHPDILKTLKKLIDDNGNVLDSASALLTNLRNRKRGIEAGIQRRLQEMTRDGKTAVFLQDDFITKRANRWVIPVRMDSKGQVPGVVHDVSKSGETAFVEPLGILHQSNELENAVAEEKAEEIRILRDLTTQIRQNADKIDEEFEIIVKLDVLNCISIFSDLMDMQVPIIQDNGIIHLVQGRHPLLSQVLLKSNQNKKVVPLDVTLGGDNTVMVITGSNAGGKTIAIKTIGLLLIMALSGMPVPADSSSIFPLIKNLLIDIGDEQSIENSLSTFSAHMSNISEIIKKADIDTLALIDELGAGTDPDEGTALACTVLKAIQHRGALIFATTHLTGIKSFVHRTPAMINASMEFDRSTMTPLFKLKSGEPGRSHALDIARKYGLPDHIIDSARELLSGINVEFDDLIHDLNEKKAGYQRALDEFARNQTEITKRERELDERTAAAGLKEKEILERAYKEASDIVSDIKKQLHLRLDDLKKMDREKVLQAIKKVEKSQKYLHEKQVKYEKDKGDSLKIEDISRGDVIYVRSLGYDATVLDVLDRRDRLRVRSGDLEIEVPVSDAEIKKSRVVPLKKPDNDSAGVSYEMTSSRINLIGLRVEAAMSELEPFLNHAALAGYNEVVIIHGIGKGLLARAVKEHLQGHPLIKSFRRGEQSEGGFGVTIAFLA